MNKSWLYFAKRNFKEILLDPLSLIFNFVFPLAMFFLFRFFVIGKTNEEILLYMPMFEINKITCAISVFSFSFITLFGGLLVSKDRTSSFINRLKISPMRTIDFILGYTLPLLFICFIQNVLIYLIAWPFGFNFFNGLTIVSLFTNLFTALFFILLGLSIGTVVSDKAVGGIASIFVNLAALLGCMFMPFGSMGKVYQIVCLIFPFIHFITLNNGFVNNFVADDGVILKVPNSSEEYYNGEVIPFYVNLIVVAIYLTIMILLTFLAFRKLIKREK